MSNKSEGPMRKPFQETVFDFSSVALSKDQSEYHLTFLEKQKLKTFNQQWAVLCEAQKPKTTVTLSQRIETLNQTQHYLRAAREEIVERELLRKKKKSAEFNLKLDVVLTFSNPLGLLEDLSDLKKLLKDQIRNAFFVGAGIPSTVINAIDALGNIKDTIEDWKKNPEKLALFVASNATTVYDAVVFSVNEFKLIQKPLIPESVAKKSKQYIDAFQKDCNREQDELIDHILDELEAISQSGLLPANPIEIKKIAEYVKTVNDHRDKLMKREGEYNLSTFNDDEKRLRLFQKRCEKIHLIRPKAATGETAKAILSVLYDFELTGIAASVDNLRKSVDLDRAIRNNPHINIARRTHRVLREHTVFRSAQSEAEFLIDLEKQHESGIKELHCECRRLKFVFSESSSDENSALRITKRLIDARKKECANQLASFILGALISLDSTQSKTEEEKEFEAFFKNTTSKVFDKNRDEHLVLNQIKLLMQLRSETNPNSTLYIAISQHLEKIQTQYEKVYGKSLQIDGKNIERKITKTSANAQLLEKLKNATLSVNEKQLIIDEIINRLLSLEGPFKEGRDKLLVAARDYYQTAPDSEKLRLKNRMTVVKRLYRDNATEVLRSVEHSDFKSTVEGVNTAIRDIREYEEVAKGFIPSIVTMESIAFAQSRFGGDLAHQESVKTKKEEFEKTRNVKENWNRVANITGAHKDIPTDTKGLTTAREEFIKRLEEIESRHKKLHEFLQTKKHLEAQSPLNPRSAYLADLTPYQLSELIARLAVAEEAARQKVFTLTDEQKQILADIHRTRQEIAMSMYERLALTSESKPADLVATLDQSTPSEAYHVSADNIATYKNFIALYADPEIKDKTDELGTIAALVMKAGKTKRVDFYNAQKTLSPIEIIGGEWTRQAETQDAALEAERKRVVQEEQLAVVKASKEHNDAKNSLERYQRAGDFRRWFMRHLPFCDGDEKKRNARSASAQVALQEANEKIDKSIKSYTTQKSEHEHYVKSVVDFVVNNIRADLVGLVENGDPTTLQEKIENAKAFVEQHDVNQAGRLNQALDFSRRFVNFIESGESYEEIEKIGKLIKIASPDKTLEVRRILQLLSGQSVYDNAEQFRKDISLINSTMLERDGKNKSGFEEINRQLDTEILNSYIADVKRNYLNTHINIVLYGKNAITEEDSAKIESLFVFYSSEEQTTIMHDVFTRVTENYADAHNQLNAAIAMSLLPEENKKRAEAFSAAQLAYDIASEALAAILDKTDADGKAIDSAGEAADNAWKNLKKAEEENSGSAENIKFLESAVAASEKVLRASLSKLPLFKNLTDYPTVRESAFGFLKNYFKGVFEKNLKDYSEEQLDADQVVFKYAEEANLDNENNSVAKIIFNEKLTAELYKTPAPTWNAAFARLVEAYASADNKNQYRLVGLQQLVAEARVGAGIDAEEEAFAVYQQVSPATSLTSDQHALIANLVTDPNPTWMHEILVRKLGTEKQLQDMHASWMMEFLKSMSHSPENRDDKIEMLLRQLIANIFTPEKFEKLVGKNNVRTIGEKLLSLIQKITTSKESAQPVFSGEINDINVLDPEKVEQIRMLGSSVTEILFQVFDVPSQDQLVRTLKSENDLAMLAKEYVHKIIESPVMAENVADQIEWVLAILLMPPTERALLKKKPAEGRVVDKTDDEFDFIEMGEIVATKTRYEYDYSENPGLFYQNTLLPLQEVVERALFRRIRNLFLDETNSAEKIEQSLAELSTNLVSPFASFDKRHVDGIIGNDSKLTVLRDNLLRMGSGNAAPCDFDQCVTWIKENKNHSRAAALEGYITACKNALTLREQVSDATVCLAIERLMFLMNAKQPVPDALLALIDQHQNLLRENNTFANRISSLIDSKGGNLFNSLMNACKNNVASGILDENQLKQLALLVEVMNDAQQKENFQKIQKTAELLNQTKQPAQFLITYSDNAKLIDRGLLLSGLTQQIQNIQILSPNIRTLIPALPQIVAAVNDETVRQALVAKNTDIIVEMLEHCVGDKKNFYQHALKELLSNSHLDRSMDTTKIRDAIVAFVNNKDIPKVDRDAVATAASAFMLRQAAAMVNNRFSEYEELRKNQPLAQTHRVAAMPMGGGLVFRGPVKDEAKEIITRKFETYLKIASVNATTETETAIGKLRHDAAQAWSQKQPISAAMTSKVGGWPPKPKEAGGITPPTQTQSSATKPK